MISEAISFLFKEVDDPGLRNPNIDQHIKNNIIHSKTLVRNFKKTGDLYLYLQRFRNIPKPGKSLVYDSMKALGLKTYEDLVQIFEQKFINELDDITTLDNFIIGESYTSNRIILR